MARESDGGKGSRINVYPMPRPDKESPWSLMSWPRPDPLLIQDPNRETDINPERLFWRSSGILAYGAGHPHPVEEEHLLVTLHQLNNPVVPKRRGRPPKIRDEVAE